eukprot:TRINITY_DN10465_c0_g1_i1.p1 TRINITY_DN10465_c0_g1~~TRINITY_DN10465_c0_g1_i1.p1  ORF type:complete len:368 (-),score=57.09 TRINITY_DN10465_c0_g1_i1:28-993(-)
MDRWVNDLPAANSIETNSIPISKEEGEALFFFNNTLTAEEKATVGRDDKAKSAIYKNILDTLQKKTREYMIKENHVAGFFMKLSCRSAKDVAVASPETLKIYNLLLSNHEGDLTPNDKLLYLYKASTESMRITPDTIQAGFNLLLSSRRIFFDLKFDLNISSEFTTHLIIRKWEHIPLEYEFRAFVSNGQMTAISQYFTQLYFPALAEQKDTLQNKIFSFWSDTVKGRLEKLFPDQKPKYVIDIAIVVDKKDRSERIVVLELNPFNISTGAGLFSWESETDSDLLEGKTQNKLEFRINNGPVAYRLRNKLNPTWRKLVFED